MYTTRQAPTRMRHSMLPPLSFLHPGGRGSEARPSIRENTREIAWPGNILSSLPRS